LYHVRIFEDALDDGGDVFCEQTVAGTSTGILELCEGTASFIIKVAVVIACN
jgi:hypothetical protein